MPPNLQITKTLQNIIINTLSLVQFGVFVNWWQKKHISVIK